jgi:hypothetical protein
MVVVFPTYGAANNKPSPLFAWKKPLMKDSNINLNEIYNYIDSWEYFLEGEQAILLENINVSYGLANGTKVIYHSLALNPLTEANDKRRDSFWPPHRNISSFIRKCKAGCPS